MEAAKFCVACGASLGASGEIKQQNEGSQGNMVAAPNATFSGDFSQSNVTHYHAPVRPPLDLSPSILSTAPIDNKTLFKASAISSAIGVVSGLFGIFGTDIFRFMDMIGARWDWLKSIPLLEIGLSFLVVGVVSSFIYFKDVKLGLPSFDRWPFVRHDRLNWIVFRRVCPLCRGTMVPKKHAPDPGRTPAAIVWECSRNPDHRLPYDRTEVEDAITGGMLNHLFNEAP